MSTTYLDELAERIHLAAEPHSDALESDLPLYRIYAVLLLAKGLAVTDEDVHNAWAAWASQYEPEHRNIIPFKELPFDIQLKDGLYVRAIHHVVRQTEK